MRDYYTRIRKIFDKISDSAYFTDDDIIKACDDPYGNWDRLWLMISLKSIDVELVSRSFPIKQLDSLT